MNEEYLIILIAIFIVFIIGIIIYFGSYFIIPSSRDFEKNSLYECGFDPFESVRNMFDVQFYLIAILFIIFDLEIVLFFPFLLVFDYLDFFSFIVLFVFIWLLILGYLYEWVLGALHWH